MKREREAEAVIALADLPEGASACVRALGTTIALFNAGGRLYATANSCPHHGAPLWRGTVGGTRLPAAPHEYVWGLEDRVLTCPWHGWEFDLLTGRALFDPTVGVRTFDVDVEGGSIVVSRQGPQ